MADCSTHFLRFNDSISLTKTERKALRTARKAVMEKIVKYFNENNQCPKVEFLGQGSFTMGTIIRPLDGDFDIDIGVYLREQTNYRADWPKPETISQWLIKALQGHTSIEPINKRACVRISYKPITKNSNVSYHVDLPVYVEYINFWDNKKTRIGLMGENQWGIKTDPVGFTNWFMQKCQVNKKDPNQLIRLVKYIKAWKDYVQGEVKFPSGIVLTTLLAENYSPHQREDKALIETLRQSYNSFVNGQSIKAINKPVEPYNDLLARLTDLQKRSFVSALDELYENGKIACEERNLDVATAYWRKHLGSRFV